MKKKYVGFIIVLAAVILSGTLIVRLARNEASSSVNADADASIAVNVKKVSKTSVVSIAALNGKIRPVQEINIVPKIPGKVDKIFFDIGQKVECGETLFTLEDKDIRLQVRQAQAGLDMANSGLVRAKGGAAELQESQLISAAASAEISYNDAKAAFERTKRLFESGAASKVDLERSESQLKLAEQQYNSAKTNLEITITKATPENIASIQAQVNQAAAALELARSQLDNTIIKSPINGIVASRNIDAGELVGSAGVAMSVIDLSSVIVDINVVEDMINKIKLGDRVEVMIKSAGDKPFMGDIINISPATDVKTQSYIVRVRIDNKDCIIKGGMFAEIKLILDKAEDVVAVPISAVVDEGDKKYVYILKGDIAEKREVSTGLFNDELIEITKGLSENEILIIKGQELVLDGSKVTVTME